METIGKGFAATVYKIERNGSVFTLKEFAPSWPAKLSHRLLRRTKHPYCTGKGIRAAYHRRRIASRLSRIWDQHNYIVDAIAMHDERSFLCQYAEGRPVSHQELDEAASFVKQLKQNLREAGLPTMSLEGLPSRYLPAKFNKLVDVRNLIVGKDGYFKLVDFESGIPRVKQGRFILDDTDFDKLDSYLRNIGDKELGEEFELLKQYSGGTRRG